MQRPLPVVLIKQLWISASHDQQGEVVVALVQERKKQKAQKEAVCVLTSKARSLVNKTVLQARTYTPMSSVADNCNYNLGWYQIAPS